MARAKIRSMSQRDYRKIPVNQIRIVNSRQREQKQFAQNVRSIKDVGLYKPILVNRRNLKASGLYDLICGEGRLLAHIELGETHITADVVDIDEELAHLMTLGENIARTPPKTIEYGRALKEMRDHGMDLEDLSDITGKSKDQVRSYIRLVEQGEERLIKGVESGAFPLTFAISIADSSNRSIQHLLMDAFDKGIVNVKTQPLVRKIIDERMKKGKSLSSSRPSGKYTVQQLSRDMRKLTREKETFVHEAGRRENRLMRVLMTLQDLKMDELFVQMLKKEKLTEEPQLKGSY